MRYLLVTVVITVVAVAIVRHRGGETRRGSGTAAPAPSKREISLPARPVPRAPPFEPLPVIETEDASMPVAPVLDADTFALARDAVMPAMRACADDAGSARVAATVRVDIEQGRLRISDARADSDALAACMGHAVQALELAAPPDQPDGAQEMTLFAGD